MGCREGKWTQHDDRGRDRHHGGNLVTAGMVVSLPGIIVVVVATAAHHCWWTVARWERTVLPNNDNNHGKTTTMMFEQQRREARAVGGQPGTQSTRDGDLDGMKGWVGAEGTMTTEAMTTKVSSGGI